MALSLSTIKKPDNPQIVDPSTGRIRDEWNFFFKQMTDQLNTSVSSISTVGAAGFVIDGGGSVITTGIKGSLRIPYAATITAAYLLADQSGSIVIDIWKDTIGNYPPDNADSITASAPPTLSGTQTSIDTSLTGWTTTLNAGDILYFNVDSVANVRRVELSLSLTRS